MCGVQNDELTYAQLTVRIRATHRFAAYNARSVSSLMLRLGSCFHMDHTAQAIAMHQSGSKFTASSHILCIDHWQLMLDIQLGQEPL